VVGAFGKQGDTDITVEAKFTVSADGSLGCFASELGLFKKSAPEALAIRGYFYGVNHCVDALELFYLKKYLPFFGWIIPINDQISNVGIGILTKRHRQMNIKKQFLEFLYSLSKISDKFDWAVQINAPEAFPLQMHFDPLHTYTSGALVVGDAAGLIDPLTGLGIGYALESAELAAVHILRSFQQKDVSWRVLRGYGRALLRKYWLPFAYARMFRNCLNIPGLSVRMIKLLQYT
jgi:flavin-dependent dehydrogenase